MFPYAHGAFVSQIVGYALALTSKVPALRDREIVSVARYQRLFREFMADWMGNPAEPAPLRAEIMAAAVVAAHNHMLRRWLRDECSDPVHDLDEAMQHVNSLLPDAAVPDAGRQASGTPVVAFRTTRTSTPCFRRYDALFVTMAAAILARHSPGGRGCR